jgi:hypothetical protein
VASNTPSVSSSENEDSSVAEAAVPMQPWAGLPLTDVDAEDIFQHANKTTIYKLRKADLVRLVSLKVQSLTDASLEELKKMHNDKLRVLIQNEVSALTITFRQRPFTSISSGNWPASLTSAKRLFLGKVKERVS